MRAQRGLGQARLVKLARRKRRRLLTCEACLRLTFLMSNEPLNVQCRIRTDRSWSGNLSWRCAQQRFRLIISEEVRDETCGCQSPHLFHRLRQVSWHSPRQPIWSQSHRESIRDWQFLLIEEPWERARSFKHHFGNTSAWSQVDERSNKEECYVWKTFHTLRARLLSVPAARVTGCCPRCGSRRAT